MFIPFLLFGMFIAAADNSNETLSICHYNGDILHEPRPSSCEATCQVGIRNRCQRCYKWCWLLMGYKLDSGNVALCVISITQIFLSAYKNGL